MSPGEAPGSVRALDAGARGEQIAGASVLAALASIVALWPYIPVVHAGAWTLVAGAVIVVAAVTGLVVRALMRRRGAAARAVVAMAAQIVAAAVVLTGLLLPQTALFGVVPTPATVDAFGGLAVQAAAEIYNGAAPLDDTLAVRAVLGTAFAGVGILIDHLVAQRLALLTACLVTVVGAVPMIITVDEADVAWFLALALLVLALLRHSARSDRGAPRHASAAVAAGVGVVAIALTVIVTPALPVSATWVSPGAGVTVDASLRLGDDLRRPNPTQVMTLATTAETAPYLRLATLSRFDGEVWRPDGSDTQPLSAGFGDPEWDEEMAGTDRVTSIRVLSMSSSRLPVPYPAERIVGLPAGWEVMASNRTVVSDAADASGSDYTVTSAVVEPTLEQITASRASGADGVAADPDDTQELPAIIAETALEVTADAGSDYQRLIALQNWFRSEFEYSLETPVEEDFDGTGADAVATFLEVRSGYCVHFAGAFALMAQTLDMPVRIVVGYLPGTLTDEMRGDEYLYSVMSDQLHAWPEVHFEGIGWVSFEPTATLGVPTAFSPAETEGGTGTGSGSTPAPTATTTTAPTTGPTIAPEETSGATGGTETLDRVDPAPVLLVLGAILLVLLLPGIIRSALRASRMRRARAGDGGAAWTELRDTMIDLGLDPSDAQTPRGRAVALAAGHDADPDALRRLVTAVEQISYARTPEDAGNLAPPLSRVLAQLRGSVETRTRLTARLLPRSLFAQRPVPA